MLIRRLQRIRIERKALKQLLTHCIQVAPNEACGFLGGRGDSAVTHVAVPNVACWPTRQFEMDPTGHAQAIKSMESQGQHPVALYHSHPFTSPIPSNDDIEHAHAYDLFYLIVGLANKSLPPPIDGLGADFSGLELRAYRIEPATKKAISVDWVSF